MGGKTHGISNSGKMLKTRVAEFGVWGDALFVLLYVKWPKNSDVHTHHSGCALEVVVRCLGIN